MRHSCDVIGYADTANGGPVICADCATAREAREWSPIFADAETDAPSACDRCEALVPENLTGDGVLYLLDMVQDAHARRPQPASPFLLACWTEYVPRWALDPDEPTEDGRELLPRRHALPLTPPLRRAVRWARAGFPAVDDGPSCPRCLDTGYIRATFDGCTHRLYGEPPFLPAVGPCPLGCPPARYLGPDEPSPLFGPSCPLPQPLPCPEDVAQDDPETAPEDLEPLPC